MSKESPVRGGDDTVNPFGQAEAIETSNDYILGEDGGALVGEHLEKQHTN